MEEGVKSIMDTLFISSGELPVVFGLYHHLVVLARRGCVDLARVEYVLSNEEIRRYRGILRDSIGSFNDRVVNEASGHCCSVFIPRRKRGEDILDML